MSDYYVIVFRQLAGVVTLTSLPPTGSWLAAYNPEAHGGRGVADWTEKPERALRFPSVDAAWDFWRQQSKVRPRRPDGKPNRPLTAYTVEIGRMEIT